MMEDPKDKAWFNVFWNSFKNASMNDEEFACIMKMNKHGNVSQMVRHHLTKNPDLDSVALTSKLKRFLRVYERLVETERKEAFNSDFEFYFITIVEPSTPKRGFTVRRCFLCHGPMGMTSTKGSSMRSYICRTCLEQYATNRIDLEVDKRIDERVLEIRKDAENDMRDFMYIATSSDFPISEGEEKTTPKKRKVDK